jgi:hypothetical protein
MKIKHLIFTLFFLFLIAFQSTGQKNQLLDSEKVSQSDMETMPNPYKSSMPNPLANRKHEIEYDGIHFQSGEKYFIKITIPDLSKTAPMPGYIFNSNKRRIELKTNSSSIQAILPKDKN